MIRIDVSFALQMLVHFQEMVCNFIKIRCVCSTLKTLHTYSVLLERKIFDLINLLILRKYQCSTNVL